MDNVQILFDLDPIDTMIDDDLVNDNNGELPLMLQDNPERERVIIF